MSEEARGPVFVALLIGMRTLDEILQAKGWATRTDIEKAMVNLRTLGGGLDTCLLEAGVVTEGQVLEALARRYRVPSVDAATLLNASPEDAALMPPKVAKRCRAIPFEAMPGRIRVAFQQPDDLTCQDEVGFALGRRVEVYVTTEVRLDEALERFFGFERTTRSTRLADRLDRLGRQSVAPSQASARSRSSSLAPPVATPAPPVLEDDPFALRDAPGLPGLDDDVGGAQSGDADAAPPRPAAPSRPHRPSSVTMTPEESRRLRRLIRSGEDGSEDEGTAPPAAPELTPELLEELSRRLDGARDRDTVGRALLSLLQTVFVRGALLAVLSDRVEGWMADESADTARFEALRLPLDQPSVFLNLKAGLPYHLGPLAPGPVHDALLASWADAPRPEHALLVPVRLGGRPVVVLYGDLGKRPPGDVPLERFSALAERAADALKRCILLKKKNL